MWQMIPAAISAGANLLGGFLGRDHQEEQRRANEALQREFAQNAIQWKVADAKKAGVHPLYAMGAPSISPSVSVQSDPLASSLSAMGADVSRAMYATADPQLRETAFSKTLQELQVRRATLQNDLLASQIARLRDNQNPPAPVSGQDPVVLSEDKLKPRTSLAAGGSRFSTDPGTSNAQEFEERYGEMAADLIFGPYVMWRDFNHMVVQPRSDSFESRRKRWHGMVNPEIEERRR